MKTIKTMWAVLLVLAFFPSLTNAESSLIVRPQIGYGRIDSLNNDNISHAGLRVLFNAGDNKRYGLEATKFSLNDGGDFSSLGIVLEQRLWDWFNMSIGTVGYLNYGLDSKNPVGLMTNLGWEPSNYKTIKPFITYRNDIIFSENTDIVHSLSIGISFSF